MTDDQPADPATFEMLPTTVGAIRDRGIWFRNAVATTPLCCPSRVSLFTGQYAHNHGVRQNDASNFPDHASTLQYWLHQNGYKTAVSGKFLNGGETDPPHFDRWSITGRVGYYDTQFNTDGRSENVTEYSTSLIERRALEFLNWFEADDGSPWLMYVMPIAPHPPATPETAMKTPPYPPGPPIRHGKRRISPTSRDTWLIYAQTYPK